METKPSLFILKDVQKIFIRSGKYNAFIDMKDAEQLNKLEQNNVLVLVLNLLTRSQKYFLVNTTNLKSIKKSWYLQFNRYFSMILIPSLIITFLKNNIQCRLRDNWLRWLKKLRVNQYE
ncbi:Hypothetical_protein [Hexamita inflata]|uniref:Hypothetical_protein n=1 Tax=Hexamita inflata TaxID=28002 RepID=A0AA86RVQ1_9EUKA|nr:Hypothetical protein HINF_LOCUS66399 [Hexamita inflata]